jgi:hypothetical protein
LPEEKESGVCRCPSTRHPSRRGAGFFREKWWREATVKLSVLRNPNSSLGWGGHACMFEVIVLEQQKVQFEMGTEMSFVWRNALISWRFGGTTAAFPGSGYLSRRRCTEGCSQGPCERVPCFAAESSSFVREGNQGRACSGAGSLSPHLPRKLRRRRSSICYVGAFFEGLSVLCQVRHPNSKPRRLRNESVARPHRSEHRTRLLL